MRKKSQFSNLLLFICFLFLQEGFVFATHNDPEKRNVLLLNSYHEGFQWTDEIVRGVEDVLSLEDIELHIEYMDAKRQFDEAYQEVLFSFLQNKVERRKYELIITSDNIAFNFAMKYRDGLFRDIPIVFSGVNYLNTNELEFVEDVLGINEVVDVRQNLELIEKLHPTCNHIVIITDNTVTGKKNQGEIRTLIEHQEDFRPEIELVYDLSFDEMARFVSSLPSTSVIYFTLMSVDNQGAFLDYDESTKFICEHASVPVYGSWGFSLDYGILGGNLLRGYDQGAAAGKIAKDILSGKDIDKMERVQVLDSRLTFDYNELKKYSQLQDSIPEGAEIINRPKRFSEKYRLQLKILLFVLLVLMAFVFVLLYFLQRTRKIKNDLEKSRNYIRSLVSNIQGVVYTYELGGEGVTNFVNADIEEFTGAKPEEFIGFTSKLFLQYVHPDDRIKLYTAFKKGVVDKDWTTKYRMVHKDGSIRWVQERGHVIKTRGGTPAHMEGLIYDITEIKKIEDDLIAANRKLVKSAVDLEISNNELQKALVEAKKSKELQELNEKLASAYQQLQQTQAILVRSEKMASVGILTAGIAHEINNPLNFIQVGITGLKEYVGGADTETSAIIDEFINAIDMGVSRTTEIVQSLNQFNRKSKGREEKCDLHKIIDNCLVMLQYQIKTSITINKHYGAGNNIVPGNEGELHQVFLNILANAVQAIDGKGDIDIISSSDDRYTYIKIQDTGCGIPEENIHKVKDPFFTTKEPGKGTGLGLAITYQVIADHKGIFEIISVEGEGTQIEIKLPIA